MIELGLARVARLVQQAPLPWRAIHVAGTNGKGSICAYASAMLQAAGLRCGRFTSPHLVDRWDCITVDERPIDEAVFHAVERRVGDRDARHAVGASEFELLTATAFEVFTREKVDVAVVEVGIGGRLDATNILEAPLATVISKVGLDHQAFLGDTIGEIALQKAGIIKAKAPCILDGTNDAEVLAVLEDYARQVPSGPITRCPSPADDFIWELLSKDDFEPHQRVNLSCAVVAVREALREIGVPGDVRRLLPAVYGLSWPGRLQKISLGSLTGRAQDVLLDGAHNAQSAEVLGRYVDEKLRAEQQRPVTWVIAASSGKAVEELFSPLVWPGDHVAAVEFGPVDGMPWVEPTRSAAILAAIDDVSPGRLHDAGGDLMGALRWASEAAGGGSLVVAGSLYLVSDVLRLLRGSARAR
ncbi:MAG: folylpolyglutamate synthase [Thelocarpon impressellum]|nr:MAG: folylpolyglutamate synthase [Thelocarpon impressellum]